MSGHKGFLPERKYRLPRTELSQRELEVVKLLGAGASRAEIAFVLGISKSAVGTYITKCREKLDIASIPLLIAWAQKVYQRTPSLTGSSTVLPAVENQATPAADAPATFESYGGTD